MDKAFWQEVLEAKGVLRGGQDVPALTEELGGYLGSPDPHLRDGVAYPLLAQWVSEGRYSQSELLTMARQLTTNLQIGLGEEGTESVFLRAFSALMLAELIHQENKRRLFEFEEADVRAILETALAYLPAEHLGLSGVLAVVAYLGPALGTGEQPLSGRARSGARAGRHCKQSDPAG